MPHMWRLSSSQLSKLLWAFSVLEVQPVVKLQQLLLAASYKQLQTANGQDCAMLLLALGRLALPVPAQWMAAFHERLSQVRHAAALDGGLRNIKIVCSNTLIDQCQTTSKA